MAILLCLGSIMGVAVAKYRAKGGFLGLPLETHDRQDMGNLGQDLVRSPEYPLHYIMWARCVLGAQDEVVVGRELSRRAEPLGFLI